jgi:hypothetical protein
MTYLCDVGDNLSLTAHHVQGVRVADSAGVTSGRSGARMEFESKVLTANHF